LALAAHQPHVHCHSRRVFATAITTKCKNYVKGKRRQRGREEPSLSRVSVLIGPEFGVRLLLLSSQLLTLTSPLVSAVSQQPLLQARMAQERSYEPPLSHRVPSTLTIGIVGFMCRTFLYAFSRTETEGLEPFLRVLDERKDASRRERGLITVSNHLSVYVETIQINLRSASTFDHQ
jgi:hypothetical protein